MFKEKIPVVFTSVAALFILLIVTIENINGRFWLNDFKVYYEAAQALISGQQVYGVSFGLGSGLYKYSPFTLLLTVPFCLLSFKAACFVQYFILSVSVLGSFLICNHIFNRYVFHDKPTRINLILIIALLLTANHLFRELHLGNINIVLLFFLLLSLYLLLNEKFVLSGLLLAIVLITKPFFGILFLPLLMRKKIKTLLSAGVFLVLFLFAPTLYTGFAKNKFLLHEWIKTMLDHNSGFPSSNTIDSILKTYLTPTLPEHFQLFLFMSVIAAYLTLFIINSKEENKLFNPEEIANCNFIMEWLLLVAIIPNLVKTDTQHFLLSLPLIIYLLFQLNNKKNILLWICFAAILFLYSFNTTVILPKKLSDHLDDLGSLGICNLFLIGMAIIMCMNKGKSNEVIKG